MFDFTEHDLDLTDMDSVLAFVGTELQPFDLLTPTDTTLKLASSAGKTAENPSVPVYRPYAVLADILSRVINTTHLNEGEGAAFRDADKTIAGWRSEQIALDAALGLSVPSAPSSDPFRWGSASVPVTIVF